MASRDVLELNPASDTMLQWAWRACAGSQRGWAMDARYSGRLSCGPKVRTMVKASGKGWHCRLVKLTTRSSNLWQLIGIINLLASVSSSTITNMRAVPFRIGRISSDEPQHLLSLNSSSPESTVYSLSPGHTVTCNNPLLLFGLCLHLYNSISAQQLQSITDDSVLQVRADNRSRASLFMNRAVCAHLGSISHDYEAEACLGYLRDTLGNYEFKLMAKLQEDVNESNVLEQDRQGAYLIYYFHSEANESVLQNFSIRAVPISEELTHCKMELLGLLSQSHEPPKIYGLGRDQNVQYQEYNPNQSQAEPDRSHPHDADFKASPSQASFTLNLSGCASEPKVPILLVYGSAQHVDKFICTLQKQMLRIKVKEYSHYEPEYNSYIFRVYLKLSQNYKKCLVNQSQNQVRIYYHESMEGMFRNWDQHYRVADYRQMKRLWKEEHFWEQIKEGTPDLLAYDTETQRLITGRLELIQAMRAALKHKVNEVAVVEAEPQQGKNPSQPQKQLHFLDNVEVPRDQLREFLNMCSSFKSQEHLSFKIDIGSYIHIVNRVQKRKSIYMFFEHYSEIVRLLSIVDQGFDMAAIKSAIDEFRSQVVQRQKIIYSENREVMVRMTCLPEDPILMSKQKMYYDLAQRIKNDGDGLLRTLLCSPKVMKEMLASIMIDFNIIFAVDEPVPCFGFDDVFDEQTKSLRLQRSKNMLDFYTEVQTAVVNEQYRLHSFKHDMSVITEIMNKNYHDYEFKNYTLSEIDEYNIAQMVAEGLSRIYFVLCCKPTSEYIYLTYCNKMVQVFRDRQGRLKELLEVAQDKVLAYDDIKKLMPVRKRAFLTGQKYLSISLPIDHIKLMSLSDFNRASQQDSNLQLYYRLKLKQSLRFRVQINAPFTPEYFSQRCNRKQTMKFESRRIIEKILKVDLGYGSLLKWREKKRRQKELVCIETDILTCNKLLDFFESNK